MADDARRLPNRERLGRQVRGIARLGSLIPDWVLRRARAATPKHAARINRIFDEHDVLLLPVIGEPPVPVGKWDSRGGQWTLAGMTRRAGFGPPWNYLGNPAAAVPAGFTDDGLPLSVQLVGRPNDEATLLSLAAQLEAERPWADQPAAGRLATRTRPRIRARCGAERLAAESGPGGSGRPRSGCWPRWRSCSPW